MWPSLWSPCSLWETGDPYQLSTVWVNKRGLHDQRRGQDWLGTKCDHAEIRTDNSYDKRYEGTGGERRRWKGGWEVWRKGLGEELEKVNKSKS